jgi:hypothetical protein
MSWLRSLGKFLYGFVFGDDPWIAVAVAAALGITALVAGAGLSAWWILPLAVAVALSVSLVRATGPASTSHGKEGQR